MITGRHGTMRQNLANVIGLLLGLSVPIVAWSVSLRAARMYVAEGDVLSVDQQALRVTISHDDIPGLMPAMTMPFPVSSADALTGVVAGTRVRFELTQKGRALSVTRLTTVGAAREGQPGLHDHTPHHGGVVSMWGTTHLEVAASPDGILRVYVSDVWRRPLSAASWTGSVTLDLPAGNVTIPFVAHDDALQADGPPLSLATLLAHVHVTDGSEPIELHVLLPLHVDTTGAALAVKPECVPLARSSGEGRAPRCTLTLPNSITAVTATPDHTTILVAVAGVGVTAWHLPGVALAFGLAPAPPTMVSPEHVPHGEVVSTLAVSPDSREVMVGTAQRLLRYSLVTGRLLRELPGQGGVVRRVVWSPDGSHLLVTAFGDAAGHFLEAEDGHEVRRVEVGGATAAAAFSADGHWAAIGSEAGSITLVDMTGVVPERTLSEPQRATENVAFAGDRLVSAGLEGLLRTWEAASGRLLSQVELGSPALSLAVAEDGQRVAVAGLDWTLRLYDTARAEVVETLVFHRAAVYGLAWAGQDLFSGDNEGRLAAWEGAAAAPSSRTGSAEE